MIAYYSLTFPLAAYLVYRRGWKASWETWFLLASFSVSRIAYGALQVSTIANPDSIGLRIAAAAFAFDGLAALFFCSIGLLKGVRERVEKLEIVTGVRPGYFRLCEALVTAASICASIGYSSLTNDEVLYGMRRHPSTMIAAAAMYIVVFAIIIACAAAMMAHLRRICPADQRTLLVLSCTHAFLLVRTVYLCLDILGNLPTYSAIRGSVTAFLLMALLEEAVVMAAFLALGYAFDPTSAGKSGIRTAEDGLRLGSAESKASGAAQT